MERSEIRGHPARGPRRGFPRITLRYMRATRPRRARWCHACLPPPTRIDTPPHRPTLDPFRGELRVGAESSPFRENPSNLIRVMPAKGQGRSPELARARSALRSRRDGLLHPHPEEPRAARRLEGWGWPRRARAQNDGSHAMNKPLSASDLATPKVTT